MSGGIDLHLSSGHASEAVVLVEVDGRPVIVAGTDGSPEAVEAARQVAVLMGQHLGRPVAVLVDVVTATVREIGFLDDRRRA